MQQADLPMSSAHSMDARKGVHAQKPYFFLAFAHESSKVGGRLKREIGKTEARRLMERKAAQKKLLGTKTRPTCTAHVNKAEGGRLKGVISKFWNFLHYWSDLTEIFTHVKSKKKHFLFMNIFPFRA